MIGQAIRPRGYEPMVDTLTDQAIRTGLDDVRTMVRRCVDTMQAHEEFIEGNCRA